MTEPTLTDLIDRIHAAQASVEQAYTARHRAARDGEGSRAANEAAGQVDDAEQALADARRAFVYAFAAASWTRTEADGALRASILEVLRDMVDDLDRALG
jgi:hypothetical protein